MNKKYIFRWFFYSVLFYCCSCRQENESLARILRRSGKNRAQLEKVLSHYKVSLDDSLKYKAAIFLILNLEDKYSYSGTQYRNFLHFVDSISKANITIVEYKSELDSFYRKNGSLVGRPNKLLDIEDITSEFLIDNIDNAFAAYDRAPWHNSVSFDDFCEYILPYRIGDQPLESYRGKFYQQYKSLVQKDYLTMQMAADSILKRTSAKGIEIMTAPFADSVPDFPISSLLNIKGGACRESADLGIYILRSMGLPTAEDFTPQWPHRRLGHTWCGLLISKDSSIDFEGSTSSKVGGHLRALKSFRIAKAYRKTFSKQINSLALIHGNEPIPNFFNTPYFKDISPLYFETTDITIDVSESIRNRFSYICVFDNEKWVPVHWGQIRNGSTTFSMMGKSVVYLPAIYKDNEIFPISSPLLVDSTGKITVITPDKDSVQTIVLRRKYPVFDWWNTRLWGMKGGVFQASNDSGFFKAKTVYKIKEVPEMAYQSVELKLGSGYKYWRFLLPDTLGRDVAEIQYFDEKDKQIKGRPIGSEGLAKANSKEKAFDNDPLTYFQGDTLHGNWIGLAFEKEQIVSKIRYLCRNDDNFIENGELYELFFWDDGKWNSLGRRTGNSSQVLVYNNAPKNALFLLHDYTKGKEERIFTYRNGKLEWW